MGILSFAQFDEAAWESYKKRKSGKKWPIEPDQRCAVIAPPNRDLFIVAGPGTGKTTCLVL